MNEWVMVGGMMATCAALVVVLWGSVLRKSTSSQTTEPASDRMMVTVLSLFTIVFLGYVALAWTIQ
jgi:hypothetical protein